MGRDEPTVASRNQQVEVPSLSTTDAGRPQTPCRAVGEQPLVSLEINRDGRKEKPVVVFRVKLQDRELKLWSLKKNERLVGNTVEQRFEANHCKILYMLSYYGIVARRPTDFESWMRQIPFNVLTFEAVTHGILDLDYAPLSIVVVADGAVRRIWMNISQEGSSCIDDLREGGHINGLKVQTKEFLNQTMFQVSNRGIQLLDNMPAAWKYEIDRFLFCFEELELDQVQQHEASTKSSSPRPGLTTVIPTSRKSYARVDSAPPIYSGLTANQPQPPRALSPKIDKDIKRRISVRFDGAKFVVFNDAGFSKKSHVTQTEDVSYCSSPYLPQCLRETTIPFKSNSYRAIECAKAGSDVEDEMDEIMALDDCMSMVAEFIPFGTNQLVGLNERLGALDRCKGGFFTNTQDSKPTDTKFTIPAGMTDVRILDFSFSRYINFEAHIQFPEEGGIVQVEEFGMHLNVDGTILYGLRVDAINDKQADNISLDSLSRMLVDVHQDSTKIMNDMLTPYQKSLMDIVFNGDTDNRGKYNVIVSSRIKPANHQKPSFDYLDPRNYMDRGEVENELKQVVGEIESSTLINEKNILIIGRGGTIFAGPDAKRFEETMVLFARLLVREKFLGYFFSRTFAVDTVLVEINTLVVNYYKNPRNIQRGRELINLTTRVVVLLREVLGYINDSLSIIQAAYFNADEEAPTDRASLELNKTLQNVTRLQTLKFRCRDLTKLLDGIDFNVKILQSQMQTVSRIQTEMVVKSTDGNFKALVAASAAQERAAISSKVMEMIFSSGFAWRLIDRCVVDTGNTGPLDVYSWVDDSFYGGWIAKVPGLFLVTNLIWVLIVLASLRRFMDFLLSQALDARSMVMIINRKVNMPNLLKVISWTTPSYIDHAIEKRTQHNPGRHVVKVCITDYLPEDLKHWPGKPPHMILIFNLSNSFLLSARLEWNHKTLSLPDEEVFRLFYEWLFLHNVFETKWWLVPPRRKFGLRGCLRSSISSRSSSSSSQGDGEKVPPIPELGNKLLV